MKLGLVVFSRMGSRRLPGKALAKIGGQTMLGHVLERAIEASGHMSHFDVAPRVVVATTDRPEDHAIVVNARARIGESDCFAGAVDDVAARALACCEHFGFDALARICGDRPFHDPELLVEAAKYQEWYSPDLTSTVPRAGHRGDTVELLTVDALRQILDATTDREDREHVTRYAYAHPDDFRILPLPPTEATAPPTVDTVEDLEEARAWHREHPRKGIQIIYGGPASGAMSS